VVEAPHVIEPRILGDLPRIAQIADRVDVLVEPEAEGHGERHEAEGNASGFAP
jgi:hypothetical protein